MTAGEIGALPDESETDCAADTIDMDALFAVLNTALPNVVLLGFNTDETDWPGDGTTGCAQGADEAGALRVQTASGLRKITSAEVSVRAASARA